MKKKTENNAINPAASSFAKGVAFSKELAKAVSTDLGFVSGIDVSKPEHLLFNCPLVSLRFEVLGGIHLKHLDRMRATLKVSRLPQVSARHAYRNTLDLYSDSQIKRFVREAADKLEFGTTHIEDQIHQLIDGLEKYRLKHREELELPKEQPRIVLNQNDTTQAMELLESKDLAARVCLLLENCGLVQEKDNGLLLFLIFLTRQFKQPLHALVHGSSGSGKTNLLKTVISTLPPEQAHCTTALTENVLFYPPYKDFWKHKVLMLEDLDGSMSALYSLRELMSNGHIVKYTTEMDSTTGEHKQKRLEAHGPVCIVGATTQLNIYEDNSNRSYLIHVDESYKHQQAVMEYQNKQAAGLIDDTAVFNSKQLLQNMQRLLNPLEVRNPYQPDLFLPACVFKPLRTNMQYITLIKAITFLHQFQLPIKTDKNGVRYVETTFEHIELANRLCRESLLRKSDLLNGQQRTFFEKLKVFLKKQGTNQENNQGFFATDVRREFRLHRETMKRNFKALENLGLIVCIGKNAAKSFEYKVLDWSEYDDLNSDINEMDKLLIAVKQKYSSQTVTSMNSPNPNS